MKTKSSSNRGGARREGREGKKGFCVFFPLFFRSFQGSLTFVPPMSQLSDAAVPGKAEQLRVLLYYMTTATMMRMRRMMRMMTMILPGIAAIVGTLMPKTEFFTPKH